jgi:integrase
LRGGRASKSRLRGHFDETFIPFNRIRFALVPRGRVVILPFLHRMKAGREHRVPLSPRAFVILRKLEKLNAGQFVFPGHARNKPLSNMAMEMVLRRMKIEEATVHGFRSSFRDWAGNVSNFPREVAETALAHVMGDKAEQAYRRSDALDKRRKLMEAWAAYCEPKTSNVVVQMGKRKPA